MIDNILNDTSYKDLSIKQIKEFIHYLQDNNYEFNLTANLDGVNFEPTLPENISDSLSKFTLFSLVNFTFTSLVIKENHIEFEAGFGTSNFGSVCTIPYYSILQLSMQDSIIFINPVATVEKYFNNEETQKQRSMSAFKLNKY